MRSLVLPLLHFVVVTWFGLGCAEDPTAKGQSEGTDSATDGDADGDADSDTDGDADFELLWTDNFDTVDLSRWQLMTHTWDGNPAQFTDNVSASNGILDVKLTESGNASKPYWGVEMRSIDTLTYGKVEASVRFAAGSGVVSSLVAIYSSSTFALLGTSSSISSRRPLPKRILVGL
jgi:hypothetical protein